MKRETSGRQKFLTLVIAIIVTPLAVNYLGGVSRDLSASAAANTVSPDAVMLYCMENAPTQAGQMSCRDQNPSLYDALFSTYLSNHTAAP